MVQMTPRALPFLVAALLAACGAPEPAERDRFYGLDPEISVAPATAPVKATLLVNDLASRGFLGGRQIVYRTEQEPLEVQRYNGYLWEEPPGRAIAGVLVSSVRAAGLFEFVVTPEQRARTDYLLGGDLSRFDHLPTAQPPRVAVDFTLTLMRGDDRRSMLSKRYQGEEPTGGDTPEAMAAAFNRLAGRLLGEVLRDLQALQPRLHPARGR